jgi:hypothetical protein
MAFQFPANPAPGDIFNAAPGVQYKWNGIAWCPYATQFPGAPIFQNPAFFADGTAAAPGIAWASDPDTGWYRADAGGTANYSINTVPIFGIGAGRVTVVPELWCSGPVQFKTHNYIDNAKWLYGRDTSGNPAPMMTVWSDNWLYLGDTSIPRTHVRGGGSVITLASTGITMTGAANFDITGSAATLKSGGTGPVMTFHWENPGGTPNHFWGESAGPYKSQLFYKDNIQVGYATWSGGVRSDSTPGGQPIWFHWSVQGGTPAYIWGGPGDAHTYLYQPANMSVNYAGYSNAAQGVYNGGGGPGSTRFVFHWHDPGDTPSYVSGCTDGTNFRVYPPGRLSVNYANSANRVNGIDGASGGTISGNTTFNGHMDIAYSGAGDVGSWGSRTLVVNGGYPGIGFHHYGVVGWSIQVMSQMYFGAGGGPGGLSGWAFRCDANGDCYARVWYTVVYRSPDSTTPMTGALSDLVKLRGVRFFNTETQKPDIGLEVDEVERAFPELVSEVRTEDGTVTGKGINYMALAAPIIEAIRELNDRVTALEAA